VGIQLGFAVWLARPYEYVPHAIIVFVLAVHGFTTTGFEFLP